MKAISEHLVFNRPLPIRTINSIGKALNALGIHSPKLDPNKIFSVAAKKAGISEADTLIYPELKANLTLFCEALESTAKLNQTGRLRTYFSLLGTLKNRFEVDKWCKENPEHAQQKIEKPIFILGLPRTGTTALFNMLADAPSLRAPLGWEAHKPIPPVKYVERFSDPRIAATQKEFDAFFYLTPKLKAIHDFGALIPQECIAFTNYDLYGVHNFLSYQVPAYTDWYEQHSLNSVFNFHKQFLQCLQSDFPAQHWLLKTPAHLSAIDQIFETYPDARIIQTHRNPMEIMGSLCSLSWHFRSTFSDQVDCQQIGQEVLHTWSKALNKAMESRDQLKDKQPQIIDIMYQDFVKDSVGSVQKILGKFDLPRDAAAIEKLKAHTLNNQKDRHGKHTYDLKDFGLDKERDAHFFEKYCNQFNLI
jgi:hypothetical protein